MSDATPPFGIRRPDPAALLEADEYTQISATLRAEIRAKFADLTAGVRGWQPGL